MRSHLIVTTLLILSLVFSVTLSKNTEWDESFTKHEALKPSTIDSAAYPDWAHHHWVWLASSQANQTTELQLVQDYLARNVPVGAVDIDSEWSTGINNFVWNNKYPNASLMIQQFHQLGVRVICWATSMIDTDSPSYQYGKSQGYYLNHGRTIKWWHGHGSFIDYTNPNAVAWWHGQMDNVLDMGLDGWKCDGTDPYVFELIRPEGYGGRITERQYANDYYGDFFNYTRTKNPEALIMSRPVDSYGPIYWSFSPHYLMFSGWVGDQDPDFYGLENALRNMFHSAWRNYTNFGSDIGGYRSNSSNPLGRTKQLFIRWAQLGAFCPLMENGGNGEHRPWMFDSNNQTLDIYRNFVFIHYELNPYLLNAGTTAYNSGVSVMKPIAERTDFTPASWDYKLWTDILVAPMVSDDNNRTVDFPSGDNWINWWNRTVVYPGGSSANLYYPLELFPIFIRQGSLIPLQVNNSLVGHGDEFSQSYLTMLLSGPVLNDGVGHQVVREYRRPSQEFRYTTHHDEAQGFKSLRVFATSHSRKLILLVRPATLAHQQSAVDIDRVFDVVDRISGESLDKVSRKGAFSKACTYGCWFVDHQRSELWVKPPHGIRGVWIDILSAVESRV